MRKKYLVAVLGLILSISYSYDIQLLTPISDTIVKRGSKLRIEWMIIEHPGVTEDIQDLKIVLMTGHPSYGEEMLEIASNVNPCTFLPGSRSYGINWLVPVDLVEHSKYFLKLVYGNEGSPIKHAYSPQFKILPCDPIPSVISTPAIKYVQYNESSTPRKFENRPTPLFSNTTRSELLFSTITVDLKRSIRHPVNTTPKTQRTTASPVLISSGESGQRNSAFYVLPLIFVMIVFIT